MASISVDLATGLAAHYKFEEPTGSDAVDTHGVFTGIDSNTVQRNTTYKMFDSQSAEFDYSAQEHFTITPTAGIDVRDDISFMTWLQVTGTPSSGDTLYIFSHQGASANKGYLNLVYNNNAGTPRIYVESSGGTTAHNVTLTANTWYQVGFTKTDGLSGTIRLYLNGSEVGSSHTFGGAGGGGQGIWFGPWYANSITTDLRMDANTIWSTALSSGNVSTYYNGGAGIPYSATSTFIPRVSFIM